MRKRADSRGCASWQIFLPCWECYDFEAGATHEIGHLLGLMHPDQAATVGKDLRRSNDTYNCSQPWAGVEVVPYVTAPPSGGSAPSAAPAISADAVAPSIMKAFTQTPPQACIFQDDLDALNTLYPVCVGHARTSKLPPARLAWSASPPLHCTLLSCLRQR